MGVIGVLVVVVVGVGVSVGVIVVAVAVAVGVGMLVGVLVAVGVWLIAPTGISHSSRLFPSSIAVKNRPRLLAVSDCGSAPLRPG